MLTNMGKISLNFIFFCFFFHFLLKKKKKEKKPGRVLKKKKRVIWLLSSETDGVRWYHFIMEARVTHFGKDWVWIVYVKSISIPIIICRDWKQPI